MKRKALLKNPHSVLAGNAKTVFRALRSTERGLTPEQAERSRELFGTNRITKGKEKPLWKRLAGAFFNPFSGVLLAGGSGGKQSLDGGDHRRAGGVFRYSPFCAGDPLRKRGGKSWEDDRRHCPGETSGEGDRRNSSGRNRGRRYSVSVGGGYDPRGSADS